MPLDLSRKKSRYATLMVFGTRLSDLIRGVWWKQRDGSAGGVPAGGAALFQAQGARANDPAFMRLGADTTTEFKIYVACETGGVTTYTSTGKKTKPTIIYDISYPKGVAVDANGKIYVANSGNNTVTTYKSDGTPTVPIITGLHSPWGVAVDANGKIYVANNGNNS